MWVFEHLSQTKAAQQSVTKFKAMIIINFVTPKAAAEREQTCLRGLLVEHQSRTSTTCPPI
jgi:hypothetical protein